MISVVEVYNDVEFIVSEENGFFNEDVFNSCSWLAQLKFIDWLTGGSSGLQVPAQYTSQKTRSWLSPFISPVTKNVSTGFMDKPEDYYDFDTLFKLRKKKIVDENGDTNFSKKGNLPIDLLSTEKFEERSTTFIEELKPENLPIAKLVGDRFYFEPSSIGSVTLQYIRYPKRSNLVMVEDSVYNVKVPDPDHSDNFEWGEYARPLLVWFIVDEVSNHTREQALKEANRQSNPLTEIGGGK